MALLRGYVKKTLAVGAVKDFIGKIEPKYADSAVLKSYYISAAGRAVIYMKWAGVDWDEIDTEMTTAATHPYDCNWKVTKNEYVTIYADNISTSPNEVIIYYELDEVPRVEAK